MEDKKKSLSEKYRKIDIDSSDPAVKDTPIEAELPKAKKEKKSKEPKAPKEKKVKEPKEKKVKEPKEKKPKKEKAEKVKEPKAPKEKKVKEPKPEKIKEPKVKKEKAPKAPKPQKEKKSLFGKKEEADSSVSPQIKAESVDTASTRQAEEIVLPVITNVKKVKPTKQEKSVKEKKSKEKKVKEPKAPKEKKVKEPKPEKIKEPKVKKEKTPKVPKEKKPREPLKGKDYLTILIAVLAVVLACTFVYFKFFNDGSPKIDTTTTEPQETVLETLSDIQIVRDGILVNLVQSDIPDVFYGITHDYKVKYYQYRDNRMVAVQATNTLSTEIDFGNETLPVKIDYIQLNGKIYGIGLFVAQEGEDVYFYNMMTFKLTNLPAEYAQDGKALLLATTSKSALTQSDILWAESFTIDLKSGATSRFLKITNRSIDMTTGAGVTDFCMLTQQGYNATGSAIPFITAREYEQGSGKQDIFVKNGSKEDLFAQDIYGKFLLTDGNSVIFMRKTNTGFDVIRKTGETEEIVRSFYGTMGTDYLHRDQYILNVNDGNLYNLLTGEKTMLVGFRMKPELMAISNDGKYVVMTGTVKNMMDYQVHIFNTETGEYAKFEDKNYSSHSNLNFIDNTTVSYTSVDPNQGYEYVVLDVSKVK